MKTRFNFLFFAILMACTLTAQTYEDPTDEGVNWAYCQLVGSQKLFSTKVDVSIDHGQEIKNIFQDNRIFDPATGKARSFNSMVDAMNFMGSLGWEFVQAYVITVSNINVYCWLLKIRVVKTEAGTYIPLTKSAAKKANGKQ